MRHAGSNKRCVDWFLAWCMMMFTCNQDDAPQPLDATKATIMQTSRLFLRNLAFTCTEDDLRELFQAHGEVSQVSISAMLSPLSSQWNGSPFVNEGGMTNVKMTNLNRDIRLVLRGC